MVRIALLVLVATVAPASANLGAPWSGGEPAGEPVGIADIAIVREELVIDLRPLAEPSGSVKVNATYQLDNTGAEKQLDLVFATGSPSSEFRITLDGKPVASGLRPGAELPESWRPPASTPLFDGSALGYDLRDTALPIGVALVVPQGRHDLAISYLASTRRYRTGEPTVFHQFSYVLSPARTWAGFGGLDLTVHVPAGWRAAVTPALKREGDTLHAVFATVPADAVALTVQAPHGAYVVVKIASGVLFAIVALGGLFAIVALTRSRERRQRDAGKLTSGWSAFGRGGLWGATFLLTGLVAIVGPDLALPAGQAGNYGYGQAFAILGVILGTIAAIAIGSIVSFVVARRVYAAAN
jgi:hypothetical protein